MENGTTHRNCALYSAVGDVTNPLRRKEGLINPKPAYRRGKECRPKPLFQADTATFLSMCMGELHVTRKPPVAAKEVMAKRGSLDPIQ